MILIKRSFAVSFLAFITTLNLLAQQGGILNNGGFETGMMCYTDWIWSQTGNDFAGDYKFSLSTDAHSGAYSMEIACAGTDCLRAAIYSNLIPTTPGQTYKMSLYSKCPANTNTFVHVPGTATGNVTQPLTCNGNWALNQFTFQSAPSAQYFFFYVFNADTSWLRVDDLVLTYADGTVPPSSVLNSGVRPVGISGQNVTVDGKPYLSLGYVNVGYYDLPAVAATGANTVNGLASYNNAACFNTGQPSYLDRAYGLGLNFLPDSTFTARLGVPAVFPSVIQSFANHKAVLGWNLADEPDLVELPFTYIPPATLTAEYSAIKSATSLPVMFDSQHAAYDWPSAVAPYTGASDVWMAEPYGPDFWSTGHAVTVFNSLQKKPIWLYQDAIDASLIVPKAYWAVINGVTGLHYFEWDQLKSDSAKLAATTQVFRELKSLNNVIFGPNVDSLVTATQGLGYTARYDSVADSLYILSVNPSAGGTAPNVQGTFTVRGLAAGQSVSVLFENRSITAQAGSFSDAFAGVSRHVYAIHSINTSLSTQVIGKIGADAARDWQFQVADTGLAAAKSAKLTNVSFRHTQGTNCNPQVKTGSLPVPLGTIIPGGTVTGDLIVNFTGCDSSSQFTVTATVSANSGRTNSWVVLTNQTK
jgi:hypothetical protein